MYNGELFTLSRCPRNIQFLKSTAGLLNLKTNILTHQNTDPLVSWKNSEHEKKILFHFINNVQNDLVNIPPAVMDDGKHVAICENLSLDDELILLKLGFSAAANTEEPAHNTLKMIDNVLSENLHFSLKALSKYILTQQKKSLSSNQVTLFSGITKKEKEVLSFVCKGLRNSEIANKMNVSVNTIKMHLQNIYKKTDCKSRGQLLVKYQQQT
ncbi:helix-turn-helix transcriptional regulator [Shewanella psychrotolerans]|uniref:helix-turn-helix transcriptional regulator n=1 Tax=Shewanella psychrotolerans TaxID=2864206 RepID=UPI001C65E5A3|nr:LuxR C-terminal-related transcriptional regulator [Shewanella psychrotolerans]QYK02000.1 LuxR C-terminal-related transcriptional regulator [Shewanella psychrotolerans]